MATSINSLPNELNTKSNDVTLEVSEKNNIVQQNYNSDWCRWYDFLFIFSLWNRARISSTFFGTARRRHYRCQLHEPQRSNFARHARTNVAKINQINKTYKIIQLSSCLYFIKQKIQVVIAYGRWI